MDEFRKYTNSKFLLNNKEVSRIKSSIIGKLKGISFVECIEKIKIENKNLEIMTTDILYNLKKNKIERKEKIIVFGLKDRLNLLKNTLYNEYFLDITFKIIPKCYRPYKLLTIVSIDKENNKTILICFILFVYMDGKSFLKIFEYCKYKKYFLQLYLYF